jgi:lysophospholipase L1-like esterase
MQGATRSDHSRLPGLRKVRWRSSAAPLAMSCALLVAEAAGCADDDGSSPAKGMMDGGDLQHDAGPSPNGGDAGDFAPRPDLGEGTGEDVITIGDSWMSLFVSGIQQSLVSTSGQAYRTYGVPGTRLLNEQIPSQYADAKSENSDIKTVVMTGGGNDIIQVAGLREDCDAGGDLCLTEVTKILDRLSSLWEEMAVDGVQDVVYVQYARPGLETVDFALPNGDSVLERCAQVPEPLRCHPLETVDLVMDDIPDGIHPSSAGYDRIAEAVYDMMIDHGIRR